MGKTIAVKVTKTLQIDVAEWCMNYGTEPGQVRADVVAYVEDLIVQSTPCQYIPEQ